MVPVIAFAGKVESNAKEMYKDLFDKIIPIANTGISQEEAMKNAAALLRMATAKEMKQYIRKKKL